MQFNIDSNKKIIFGWSAKCGCSHVKKIYIFLQTGEISNGFPHKYCRYNNKLPEDIENYTTIVVSRNPYERVVSGFVEKYVEKKIPWKLKNVKLTFSNFIDQLIKNQWNLIDKHHFIPQTGEMFNNKILNSKLFRCYDINKIDYGFIEEISSKKIPTKLINLKFGQRKRYKKNLNEFVFDLDAGVYSKKNVDFMYFYNQEILDKVFNFYKKDFEFFEKCGINYSAKDIC